MSPSDEATILATLKQAVEPVPGADEVAGLAKAAFSFRTMDRELAELQDEHQIEAAMRDGTSEDLRQPQILVFRADAAWVEVQHVNGDLIGQVIPPTEGTLTVENADGELIEAPINDIGCFIVRVPAGLIRLHLATAESSLVTEWLRL